MTDVPLLTMIELPANAVALLVPPFAIGRTPETSVVRTTELHEGAPVALPCSTVVAVPRPTGVDGTCPAPPPRTRPCAINSADDEIVAEPVKARTPPEVPPVKPVPPLVTPRALSRLIDRKLGFCSHRYHSIDGEPVCWSINGVCGKMMFWLTTPPPMR